MTPTLLDARTEVSTHLQKAFASDSPVTQGEADRIEAYSRQRGWRLKRTKLVWSSGISMDDVLRQFCLAEAA
jgi:hypothetical protein